MILTRKRKAASQKSRRNVRRRGAYSRPTYMLAGTNPANKVTFKGYGFPDRLTTNLLYAESIILDPSVSTPCPFNVYLINSAFDPNNAIGGGQPTYYDQLASVYDRYIVNGAKITATFSRATTTASGVGPYLCGIQMSDQTSLPSTSPSQLMSSPNTIARLVSQDDGSVSVTQTYSRAKVYPDFSDALNPRVNSNPTIGWFAKVFATPQGTNIDDPINCTIIIEFNVTFSDTKQVVDL